MVHRHHPKDAARAELHHHHQDLFVSWMRCVNVFFAACVAAGTGSALAARASSKVPHVVYFLVDDLGNANVGFHNDEPLTPTIDSLARHGAILDRFCKSYRYLCIAIAMVYLEILK